MERVTVFPPLFVPRLRFQPLRCTRPTPASPRGSAVFPGEESTHSERCPVRPTSRGARETGTFPSPPQQCWDGGCLGALAPGRASIIHCLLFTNNPPTAQTGVSFCPLCCCVPTSPFLCGTHTFLHTFLPFWSSSIQSERGAGPGAEPAAC